MEALLKNLKSRNMNGYFVKDRDEAKKKVLSLIDKSQQIAFGGSITLDEIGIMDELRNGSYKLIDRDLIHSNHFMKRWVMKASPTQGTYLTGTNAITEEGEIFNVDGMGNRVNAIQFGPDKVIIVVGKNKIVKDIHEAIKRVENIAAPKNTARLKKNTPCVKEGHCVDCRSPERICNIWSIIKFQNHADRIHVIIIDEDLGY